MKKVKINIQNLLSFITLLFLSASTYGQITGNAFLQGQTDHNGIKVKFIPVSPTASLDSTYTNSSGNYSITITGGTYLVVMTKENYMDFHYNGGDEVTLSVNESLDDVTLQEGNTEYVSGIVSGNWINTTMYVVDGDIIIAENDSLIIQDGTQIKFNGNYILEIYGFLNAVGEEDSPIMFTSINSTPVAGDWGGIRFYDSADDNSILSGCIVEYGGDNINISGIIYINNSNPTISNNEIRFISGNGIYFSDNSSSLVKNNKVHDFTLIGIWVDWGNSSPTIKSNEVYNGFKGIKASTNSTLVIINGNIVYDMSSTCLDVANSSNPLIVNNSFYNSNNGIIIEGVSASLFPIPTIAYNYIFNISGSGIYFDDYAEGVIKMNIIISNAIGIRGSDSGQPTDISYNLVWNNSSGNYLNIDQTGTGEIVSTNSNGTPCDSYFNISLAPQFQDSTNGVVILSSTSPCIDAGNTDNIIQADYYDNVRLWDGNNDGEAIADIGPHEYDAPIATGIEIISNSQFSENNIVIYPNPSHGIFNITIANSNYKYTSISILNIEGKKVFEKQIQWYSGDLSKQIDLTNFIEGIYFLIIRNADSYITKKIVIL
jgi:hypothetical protein